MYLCVLPDSDHEACPVDALSESNTVDTTDADTYTADSTDSTPKKKFLRKKDSGTYNIVPHYSMNHVLLHCGYPGYEIWGNHNKMTLCACVHVLW